ncbi:MAG: nucleotidyltransferase domain-containing protein [Candidatus Hydrogenedentes bacterium]|nr:nucleotidyltransferase domain-containing protein [Candidatus Hydrogenedentota bacterium]
MNAIEHEILHKLKALLQKRLEVRAVALFGSRARGDAEPDSDMDVLVVVETLDREVDEYISQCAWEAGFEHGIVVVPVAFSRYEWESDPERVSLLSLAIRYEGIFV